MKILQNRAFGFAMLFIVYALATAGGVIVYWALSTRLPSELFWLNLLIADVIATVITFFFSLSFGNASVYDPYWSVQPIVIVIAYAAMTKHLSTAQILPLVAVLVWGVRLTVNWAYTFHGLHLQDWRYTMLKEKTGKGYFFINFIGIHMVPTLIVYGCTLPVVFTLVENPPFNAGSAVFFVVSLAAVLLQGTADIQMHTFRKKKKGGFIRDGLWKYSRHPNYLGEIVMWWAVALAFVCIMPQRWYLIAGALANTVLFLSVSIPMADKRQSRKPGFEAYKKATRMLLPIKKKGA